MKYLLLLLLLTSLNMSAKDYYKLESKFNFHTLDTITEHQTFLYYMNPTWYSLLVAGEENHEHNIYIYSGTSDSLVFVMPFSDIIMQGIENDSSMTFALEYELGNSIYKENIKIYKQVSNSDSILFDSLIETGYIEHTSNNRNNKTNNSSIHNLIVADLLFDFMPNPNVRLKFSASNDYKQFSFSPEFDISEDRFLRDSIGYKSYRYKILMHPTTISYFKNTSGEHISLNALGYGGLLLAEALQAINPENNDGFEGIALLLGLPSFFWTTAINFTNFEFEFYVPHTRLYYGFGLMTDYYLIDSKIKPDFSWATKIGYEGDDFVVGIRTRIAPAAPKYLGNNPRFRTIFELSWKIGYDKVNKKVYGD